MKNLLAAVRAWLRRVYLNPSVYAFIGSASLRQPIDQPTIFVEVIPRGVADCVVRTSDGVTGGRHDFEDNASGYESLNDAIICAEHIVAGFLLKIELQNLLFVFAQTFEALDCYPLDFPPSPLGTENSPHRAKRQQNEQRGRGQENNTNISAVIFCKLRYPEMMEELRVAIKQDCADDTSRHEVTWGQFQDLKQRLHEFSLHRASYFDGQVILPRGRIATPSRPVICRDCAHQICDSTGLLCNHPLIPPIDLLYGIPTPCDIARSSLGKCGENGALFVAQPEIDAYTADIRRGA